MAEIVNIASLNIDTKKLVSGLSSTKKSIDELTKANKELKDSGDTSSETFVNNANKIKTLSASYSAQHKILEANKKATNNLNNALKQEVVTINDAKSNNKELRAIRNTLNTETKEGTDAIEKLNEKINSNTEVIKDNVDELENQKIGVGGYAAGIRDALNPMSIFNDSLGSGATAGASMKKGLKAATSGMLNLTKSSLKFIRTPIGAVLGLLVDAFALIKNAMNRSEESTNKITKVFSVFSGVTNKLLKVLEPLGKYLIDGLVKGFELAEKGVTSSIAAISKGLNFLGLDGAAKSVDGFNASVKQTIKDSKELADAEASLQSNQRKSRLIQLEYLKDAEKLRQVRDDTSKSIALRQKANTDLGILLKKQSADELAIANQSLQLTNLKITQEGTTTALLDERAEKLTEIADVNERITGQESEQLTNINSLRKEGSDKVIAQQQAELDLFIATQGFKSKTLEEQLNIDIEASKKEEDILKAKLKNKEITQTEYDLALLENKNELLSKQAELTIQNAQIELDAYIQSNQSKLDNDLFFSEESKRIEEERLNDLASKQREFEAKRLEEGVINQTEFNAAINEINNSNDEAIKEVQLTRDEAEKVRKAENLLNEQALGEENFIAKFEADSERIELERQREIENAELTGADTTLINQKYAQQQDEIERIKNETKLNLASDTLGSLITLAGKESKVGKALAIAQTTITTFQSATNAFNSLSGIPIVGPILGGIAAASAVASGIANVKKITSTKPKFAKGGILSGRLHSEGGIDTPYGELEGGEAVINRKSTRMYAPLLSQINQAGGGVSFGGNSNGSRFEQGGILGSSNVMPKGIFDTEILIDGISNSIKQLPSPVVSVSDIITTQNNVQVIESNSIF